MRFAAPEYLALLWIVLFLAVVRLLALVRRRRRARAFAHPERFRRLVPDLDLARRALRDGLRLAAAASLVLALARPQFGQRLAVLKREGVDVMVAIDTSASMLAEDLRPSRMATAKRAVIGLSERLRGDRLGIVVFSGSAFVQCPLTLDAKAARLLIEAIGPEIVPDPGSAIAAAIDRATSAFASPEKRYKALVLLTDGEETAGGDPIAAARRAAEAGVKIFTVGLGAERGEPIPVRNPDGRVVGYKRDRSGEVVVSRLDEGTLKEVARAGNGAYFRASPILTEIDALYAEIDAMEKREIQGGFHAHYEDRFHWFAVFAFLCLAAARLIGERSRLPKERAAGLAAAEEGARPERGAGARRGARAAVIAGLLAAAVLVPSAGADEARAARDVKRGNRALARGDAKAATEHYVKALEEEPERPEIQYNLGNALYTAKQFADATAAFGTSAAGADSVLQGSVRYNLGNALYRQGKYAEAAGAFKQVLREHPADEAARWNLELALKKLRESPPQPQPQPDPQKDQNEKDQDQKDENQSGQNQDQQQQDQQDPQTKDQQQADQPSPSDPSNQEKDAKPEGQGPDPGDQEPNPESQDSDPESPPDQGGAEEGAGTQSMGEEQGMSPEEAARLLEALGNDEQKLLRERFRARGRRVDVEKDW
jgi:Ca-activated chloride channel homolog